MLKDYWNLINVTDNNIFYDMNLNSQMLFTKIGHDHAFGAIAAEHDSNIKHKGEKMKAYGCLN